VYNYCVFDYSAPILTESRSAVNWATNCISANLGYIYLHLLENSGQLELDKTSLFCATVDNWKKSIPLFLQYKIATISVFITATQKLRQDYHCQMDEMTSVAVWRDGFSEQVDSTFARRQQICFSDNIKQPTTDRPPTALPQWQEISAVTTHIMTGRSVVTDHWHWPRTALHTIRNRFVASVTPVPDLTRNWTQTSVTLKCLP